VTPVAQCAIRHGASIAGFQTPHNLSPARRVIDIGNIIHPTDVNGLVDVTQIEPISLIFTLPEADFVPIQERLSQGPVTVFVDSQDGKQLDQGKLNLIDNQIIQTTGTIRQPNFPTASICCGRVSSSTRGCSSIPGITA
jgi:hypothetical protein